MELQLVSKDIAIKLKEIGFNWSVSYWYMLHFKKPRKRWYRNMNANRDCYSAPTQALVIKWLREAHGIEVLVESSLVYNGKVTYRYTLWKSDNNLRQSKYEYKIWEQAEEAGIKEALIFISNGDKRS